MKFVLQNAHLSLDLRDLSSQVQSLALNVSVDLPDATAMGDGSRMRLAGLKDWSVQVNFFQDFNPEQVDEIIFPAISGRTPLFLVIRADAGEVSKTNPEYFGYVGVQSYPILSQEVGQVATTLIEFFPKSDLFSSFSQWFLEYGFWNPDGIWDNSAPW